MSSLITQQLENTTSLVLLEYTILLLSKCITEIFTCLYLFSPISFVRSCCGCCPLFFRDIRQVYPLRVSFPSRSTKLHAGLLHISQKYSTSASLNASGPLLVICWLFTSFFNDIFPCRAFGHGSWSWISCADLMPNGGHCWSFNFWTTLMGGVLLLLGITIISSK